MRTKILLMALAIGVLAASCDSGKNYIELRSIDGKQVIIRDASEVQVFPNTTIDSSLLHQMIRERNYSDKSFPTILASASDSGSFVMRIDTKESGVEGKYFLSLFLEGSNRRIEKLYTIEGGEGALGWRLLKDAYSIKADTLHGRVRLSAVVKVITFNGSFSIRFPFSDSGWYGSGIDRYMIVGCDFDIGDDSLSYIFPDNSVKLD